jgi:hypothetical protein
MILTAHNEERFRTYVAEKTVTAGSTVQLKVEEIAPLAPLVPRVSYRSRAKPAAGNGSAMLILLPQSEVSTF